MKKPDVERLKKIITTWDALDRQIAARGITREALLNDEFSQWAITTPLYNIVTTAQPALFHVPASTG